MVSPNDVAFVPIQLPLTSSCAVLALQSSESLAPQVLRRINRETGSLRVDPPEGIRVIINEDDLADVRAWVAGPPGTPYEGATTLSSSFAAS